MFPDKDEQIKKIDQQIDSRLIAFVEEGITSLFNIIQEGKTLSHFFPIETIRMSENDYKESGEDYKKPVSAWSPFVPIIDFLKKNSDLLWVTTLFWDRAEKDYYLRLVINDNDPNCPVQQIQYVSEWAKDKNKFKDLVESLTTILLNQSSLHQVPIVISTLPVEELRLNGSDADVLDEDVIKEKVYKRVGKDLENAFQKIISYLEGRKEKEKYDYRIIEEIIKNAQNKWDPNLFSEIRQKINQVSNTGKFCNYLVWLRLTTDQWTVFYYLPFGDTKTPSAIAIGTRKPVEFDIIKTVQDLLQKTFKRVSNIIGHFQDIEKQTRSAEAAGVVAGITHTYKNLLSPIHNFFGKIVPQLPDEEIDQLVKNLKKSIISDPYDPFEKEQTVISIPYTLAYFMYENFVLLKVFYRIHSEQLWTKIHSLHFRTAGEIDYKRYLKPTDLVRDIIQSFCIAWTAVMLEESYEAIRTKFRSGGELIPFHLKIVSSLDNSKESVVEDFSISLVDDLKIFGVSLGQKEIDGVSIIKPIKSFKEIETLHHSPINIPKLILQAIFEEIALNCVKHSADGACQIELNTIENTVFFKISNKREGDFHPGNGINCIDMLLKQMTGKEELHYKSNKDKLEELVQIFGLPTR